MKKRRWLMLAGTVVALVALAGLAAACGDDGDDNGGDGDSGQTDTEDGATDGEEPTVDVTLAEFSVGPSVDTVSAGTVTFSTSNHGAIVHNLRVIKTDLDPDALPVDEDTFMVDESQVDIVASSVDLEAGESKIVSADLDSGSYLLICNIATHYDAGMTVGFTVE